MVEKHNEIRDKAEQASDAAAAVKMTWTEDMLM